MQHQAETTTVRNLIENWAQAVRNRDIDAILAHHSSNFVMYDVPPPFQLVGLDAYRQTWELFFGNSKVGLEKINGQWTILHEHHSVPSE